MSSGDGGIGLTLTAGVQDIAAILPLLGTEQCSIHVSSALTRGHIYAASAPMSIFGSLGIVSAGFKTLLTCLSFGDFEGADLLGNMGFEPQGENLSLIMVETGKGENKGRYVIKNRIDALIDELNIDKTRITGVYRIPQVRCLEYQDDDHDCAPVCAQHYSIYLYKSGCQPPELEKRHDMVIPDSSFYWRLHHSRAHSTTHTKTNHHSFPPIPCEMRPAA